MRGCGIQFVRDEAGGVQRTLDCYDEIPGPGGSIETASSHEEEVRGCTFYLHAHIQIIEAWTLVLLYLHQRTAQLEAGDMLLGGLDRVNVRLLLQTHSDMYYHCMFSASTMLPSNLH